VSSSGSDDATRLRELRLRPLRLDDEAEAIAAHEELARDGFDFLLDWSRGEPWADYLARLERQRCGLAPDRVPATFLVAQVGPDLVGRVSIRHELNTFLTDFGGHIGFGVRPAYRRLGHAAEILRQALVVARALGVDAALVTCDEINAASARVIEGAGGVLEDTRRGTRRYWVA
jgi:predicted acetyltransferase